MKFPRVQQSVAPLLLLGLAAYSTSLAGAFQFDDFYLIVHDPGVASLGAAWRSLPASLRPLTKLTLAANVSLHGLRPAGFHLVNLGLHLFSGLLLYRIVQRIKSPLAEGPEVAWVAAALFLLHPAQTEAVTYLSGRSTSLMTAGLLLAHWCWLRAEESAQRGARWRWASLGAYLAAVLAKEVALVYPLLALIWLKWMAGRSWRQAVRGSAPWAVVSGALFFGLLVHPRYRELVGEAAHRLPALETFFSQVHAVVALLGIVVCPWRVNIDHALPVAHRLAEVWPHLLVLLGVIGFAGWVGKRLPVVAGGLLWGLAALAPTNSVLVRQDLIADRLLYLPMVGFSLALAYLWAELVAVAHRRSLKAVPVGTVVIVGLVLALGAATFQRNLLYRSEIALWEDSVAKAPHNPRGHHNLGYAYELAGQLDPAIAEYRLALALQPGNPRYQRSLVIALGKRAAAESALPAAHP